MNLLQILRNSAITLAVLIAGFQTASLFGFVPSCEKELATLYPAALKADLSACGASKTAVKPTAAADLAKFTSRLNGTWNLKMRTVQGITSDARQLSARLYFDLSPESAVRAAGGALMLERPKDETVRRVSTPSAPDALAFWEINISQKGKMALSFGMVEGEGSKYEPVVRRAVKQAEFSELENVFVSVDKLSPKAEAWDRIILSDNTLVFLSCQRGVIERYSKVSGQKPEIDGLRVKAYWQKQKVGRIIAAARVPSFAK